MSGPRVTFRVVEGPTRESFAEVAARTLDGMAADLAFEAFYFLALSVRALAMGDADTAADAMAETERRTAALAAAEPARRALHAKADARRTREEEEEGLDV